MSARYLLIVSEADFLTIFAIKKLKSTIGKKCTHYIRGVNRLKSYYVIFRRAKKMGY